MTALIKNYSFTFVFIILTMVMGLFFIFSLTEESSTSESFTEKSEQIFQEMNEQNQVLLVKEEQAEE